MSATFSSQSFTDCGVLSGTLTSGFLGPERSPKAEVNRFLTAPSGKPLRMVLSRALASFRLMSPLANSWPTTVILFRSAVDTRSSLARSCQSWPISESM